MHLDSNFEDELQAAMLDTIEQRAHETIAPELEAGLRDRLERYGDQNDYDVRSILAALTVSVERMSDRVVVRARLPSPALLFERGTVAHTVEAKSAPVLSFVWERRHDPPQWVREEFDRATEKDGWRVFLPEVSVEGLPEGRFVRQTLAWLERQLP